MENEVCFVYCEWCEEFIDGCCSGYACGVNCLDNPYCQMKVELEECFKKKETEE